MRSLTALASVALLAAPAESHQTQSPDGRVVVEVTPQGDGVGYSVTLDGAAIVEPSPLGLETDWGDFTTGVTVTKVGESPFVGIVYDLPNGKRSKVETVHRETTYRLASSSGEALDLVVRVADNGVAFRYVLPEDAPAEVTVRREATVFDLPSTATGFLHPMAVSKTGWSRTQPSYEELYSIDKPVGTPSTLGQGWSFPALFRVGERGWALVSETGLAEGYCGGRLAHESPDGKFRVQFPQPEDHTDAAPVEPTLSAGGATPWRTIVVGDSLGPIVESTLSTDLVDQLYDAEPVRPGRAAWSWLPLKDDNTVAPVQREFVAMAARLGWEYVLIDADWDQKIGREEIETIAAEAREQGVDVLLWYNSNGQWNDAPYTPKDRMDTPGARAEEMAWLERIGAKGIKVDFFGGDKQAVFALYDATLRDAAKYGLSVNFHGTTLPRGWSRMYPNFATNEAVRGMEFCSFEQPNADAQPVHCTVLPFTRNAVAPMDFTPLMVAERLGPGGDNGPHRRTRLSYEMALPVLYHSPITHFGITPKDLDHLPEIAIEYLKAVPTVWDETRYVAGYPGKFAVLARRKGETWWVAGVNGTDQPVEFELPADLSTSWTVLADSDFNEVREGRSPTDGKITLPAKGGVVMWSIGR